MLGLLVLISFVSLGMLSVQAPRGALFPLPLPCAADRTLYLCGSFSTWLLNHDSCARGDVLHLQTRHEYIKAGLVMSGADF